ncbi:MAG TPA: ribonuclease III [Smithellaceae bacterium]|nr:ribonuclease III [Smithellaceae bacterium]HRS90028.1 ribonuclease III [Smithellaceae bacterium]HRV26884.1 ribonuclease III [Smithellaceae bacterium]
MDRLFPDKKRMNALNNFAQSLPYRFRDISLLNTAFVHRTYLNENPLYPSKDNERFEYLGDAVLSLSATNLICKKFPLLPEGALTKIRSAVVNEKSLALLGKKLSVGDHLLMGRGEDKSGGRDKASILANTMEAVFAAIFLDAGFEKADKVINNLLEPILSDTELIGRCFDYKSALQEFCQKAHKTKPHYEVLDRSGPEHNVTFKVRLTVEGILTQNGLGKGKKEAEKNAAEKAWNKLHGVE